MKYQGKSMMSLNEMVGLAIEYEGDGYVTGYPIVSGNDAYILNGVIEANEEYIVINQWVPVFPESLKPVSPSLSDDQQIVLDYLKDKCNPYSFIAYKPFEAIIRLSMLDPKKNELRVKNTIDELTYVQQSQVLETFSRWVQEQEEE